MINYLRSECYRILRYKWTYLFILICSVAVISTTIVLAAVKYSDSAFPYATTRFVFSFAYTSMGTVYLLCLVVSNMIFNNEYGNQTMKNCVSYGISRRTIFFGKLAIQILYSLIAFAVIMGMFVASAFLLLENTGKFELIKLVRTCLASLPLLISGLATMNCFAFFIEGSSAAATASVGVMLGLPTACNLLGMRFELFDKFKDILPWNILNYSDYDQATETVILYWDSQKGFINCWTIGIAITAIITFFGFLMFQKKEIK